jgi:hypothetical protein
MAEDALEILLVAVNVTPVTPGAATVILNKVGDKTVTTYELLFMLTPVVVNPEK